MESSHLSPEIDKCFRGGVRAFSREFRELTLILTNPALGYRQRVTHPRWANPARNHVVEIDPANGIEVVEEYKFTIPGTGRAIRTDEPFHGDSFVLQFSSPRMSPRSTRRAVR
jgi:hypothetical protein